MSGENVKSGNNAPNPDAAKWENIYKELENKVNDNFLDNKEFIEKKLKRPIEYSKKDASHDLENAEAKRDEELKQITDYKSELERIQNRSEGEYNKEHYEEFVNETNINSKTGKERTFNDFDNYLHESGEDRKRRHDITVISEYIPKLPNEDATAYSKRISKLYEDFPRKEGEDLDSYRERMKEADENNALYEKTTEYVVDQDGEVGKWLKEELKDVEELQGKGGVYAETANSKKRELYNEAMNRQLELNRKQDKEAKLEKLKEVAKLKKQLLQRVVELNSGDETPQGEEAPQKPEAPLTAINIDYTHDEREIAHDLAEQALNAEVASEGNIIKKIWKGTLFKKYYEKKYEREFARGERTNENGETVMAILQKQMPDTMERFVLGVVEDDSFIHRRIGKRNEDGTYSDGEKLEKMDEETNEKIKSAIAEYARKRPAAGEKVSDLNREFTNNIGRILAELNDSKGINTSNNNYLNVAEEAAKRYQELSVNLKTEAEHEAAIEQVMAGFQAYNAEARSNVRTEAHRDNIDKIVNAIESGKIGRFIPPEIVAGAVGAFAGLTQTGARAIGGAAGGIIASGIISGLKERNRITEDRARMMRDAANGMEYNGEDSDKKTAKYEKRIGGTLYDMKPAKDLASNIEEAIKYQGEGRSQRLMEAIAEARVRIDFSDSEQKDLISYSSSDQRGKERLELDKILIKAEHALTEKGRKDYETMQGFIRDEIINGYEDESGNHHAGVEEQDKDFKKFRTISALKRSGKTIALGASFFLASQEIMALADPTKIGVFEKAGLLDKMGVKTENNTDASETLIASGFGRLRGKYEMPGAPRHDIHENISDPDQVKYYEEAGYTKVETVPATSQTTSSIEQIDPSASTAKVDVKYDGWANNGTKFSDGNELRAHIENGKFISTMRGSSTMNGENIPYDPSTVKAYITVGDSKFEIAGSLNDAGQMTWGENGVFTTTTGETIKAIGDNGEKLYRYFEIAADNGVDTNGIQHIIPLATDVGANSFAGKLEQVVETVTETPASYTFIRDIAGSPQTFVRNIDFSGIGFAPVTARTGLGRANAAPAETEPAVEQPAPAAEAAPVEPEPAPAGGGNLTYSQVEAPVSPASPAGETAPAPSAGETSPVSPAGEAADIPPSAGDASGTSTESASQQAPEGGQQTPESAPDNKESTSESISDYQQAIKDRSSLIGDTLTRALLNGGNGSYPSSETQASWVEAMRKLPPEGKSAFREIMRMRSNIPDEDKSQLTFGNALAVTVAVQELKDPGFLQKL